MRNPFRRKKADVDSDGPSVHYLLAHRVLPAVFHSQPFKTMAGLGSPDSQGFLQFALSLASRDGHSPFPVSDLQVHRARVHHCPAAILEMPPPREPAEAYFVAMVVPMPGSGAEAADGSVVTTRYITLERTTQLPGVAEQESVLGEWTTDGHANFGEGGPPTVENFLRQIEKLVPTERPTA